MKLVEKLKNGTEMYRLDDGRLGKIYPKSGYVRVTTLRHGIRDGKYHHEDSTKNSRWYQINKKEKYKDKDMKLIYETDRSSGTVAELIKETKIALGI